MNSLMIKAFIKSEIIVKEVAFEFIYKSLKFELRPHLRNNSRDVKSLSTEILFDKERNSLINALYRSPKFVHNLTHNNKVHSF